MSDYPNVEIKTWNYKDGRYTQDNKAWSVARLIKLTEDIDPIDVPVAILSRWYWPWEDNFKLDDFISHVKRVQESDLSIPILIAPDGSIVDGMHRICKAVLNGDTTIKAKYISKLPECDEIIDG